jgi:GNAT superfamily N-acetyltransferase
MISIQVATHRDHIAIAALHAESWKQNYRGIYTESYLANGVDEDRKNTWHKRLSEPAVNQRAIMAIDAGELIGFACVFLDNDPGYGSLLDNLHVSSGKKNTGVGKMLMKACADLIAREALSQSMYLWVYEVNTNARNFYDRLGADNLGVQSLQNKDGSFAPACRYVWKDVGLIARA